MLPSLLIHPHKPIHFSTSLIQQTTRHGKTLHKNATYSIQFNSIQYSRSGSSSLQSLNDLCKRRSCIRILIPTIPNECRIPLRTRIWNWQSLLMCMHHHRDLSFILFRLLYLHRLHAIVRDFPSEQLPQIDSVRVHIGLFCVNVSADHFRSHPLIRSTLPSHHSVGCSRLKRMKRAKHRVP